MISKLTNNICIYNREAVGKGAIGCGQEAQDKLKKARLCHILHITAVAALPHWHLAPASPAPRTHTHRLPPSLGCLGELVGFLRSGLSFFFKWTWDYSHSLHKVDLHLPQHTCFPLKWNYFPQQPSALKLAWKYLGHSSVMHLFALLPMWWMQCWAMPELCAYIQQTSQLILGQLKSSIWLHCSSANRKSFLTMQKCAFPPKAAVRPDCISRPPI